MPIEKTYNAATYEDKIYRSWERAGVFAPTKKKSAKPFTVMMPPPNATGTLHLGHAVMLALEDIMVRYHRMKGDAALWIPGTDHASIATQNKVEKLLAEEGKTRHDLGREAFLGRVADFVRGSQDTIRRQVRKMGSSCDWSRERYTLEPMLSQAVREVFVRMYEDGLIYRGHRIVNWCPRCSSTLADDEVEYKEEKSKFYYLKYGPFVIGTARPETKFQDKIIVVHPDDERYKQYIGTSIMVPWIEGEVKAQILSDKSVDMAFGTGAMTITPAHDFNDFEIAKRHKLPILQIIDEKGNLTSEAGSFSGRNAREVRDELIAKLAAKGLVERIDEKYVHNISLCYRCSTPVEPLVSEQWFISVDTKFGKEKKSLKQRSLDVVRKGEVKILPERFEKTYFHWMENLHDWCISRQIWFGHKIPVWYCECSKEPIVSRDAPKKCPRCGAKNLKQDPDTLDTWFSSGLWTFSTLGWPDKTPDLKRFHPTNVLETGYDILFFWVARMILMTSYALNEVPFKTVYLHGLVRTREGKKMSKSDPKTCIDPLDMIAKYGADALRLSMVMGSSPGNDLRLYEEKIAGFRNFVNKIWNAARFATMQGGKTKKRSPRLALADKWILHRTQELILKVTDDIDHFRFSDAGTKIYDFTWGEYCAWYLEIAKGEDQNLPVLNYVLETALRLLHPFTPFVTEKLWERLGKKDFLAQAAWPVVSKKFNFPKEASQMQVLVDVITAIRNLRQENAIDPGKRISVVLVSEKWKTVLEGKREVLMRLARLESLTIEKAAKSKQHPSLTAITNTGVEIFVSVGGVVDLATQRKKLNEEKDNIASYIKGLEGKLKNKNFVERAPKEIVKAEQEKLGQAKQRLQKTLSQLEALR